MIKFGIWCVIVVLYSTYVVKSRVFSSGNSRGKGAIGSKGDYTTPHVHLNGTLLPTSSQIFAMQEYGPSVARSVKRSKFGLYVKPSHFKTLVQILFKQV